MNELVKFVRSALDDDDEAADELGDIETAAELLCSEVDRLELEIVRLRTRLNPECPGCGLRPNLESAGCVVWCDECSGETSQLRAEVASLTHSAKGS